MVYWQVEHLSNMRLWLSDFSCKVYSLQCFIPICSSRHLAPNFYAIFDSRFFALALSQERFTSLYPLFGRQERERMQLVKKEESVPVSARKEENVAYEELLSVPGAPSD